MNSNTIQITLSVKDDGSVTLANFGKTGTEALERVTASGQKTTSAFNTLKSSYLEMTAKAASVYMAIQQGMEYMEKGAKAEQAEASFRSLSAASGESADAIISNMKRAVNGTIDDSMLMQKAVKANLLGLTSDQTTQIAEMARQAARTSGEDVSTTFDNLVNAISTKMPRALKQYGLVTKEQQGIMDKAIAEGVEDVDLFTIAWENFNKQHEKTGPLVEDNAEKMQQYKSNIEDFKEGLGKVANLSLGFISHLTEPIAAMAASVAGGFDPAPMVAYFEKLAGLEEEVSVKTAAIVKTDAVAKLQASQQALAQKQSELNEMQSLNKTYFAEAESSLKSYLDIVKATGGDELTASKAVLDKRLQLLTEYAERSRLEITKEAALRKKEDQEKLTDAQYIAGKMQAIDADVAAKNAQIQREKMLLSAQTAKADLQSLESRLNDYQTYYDSLKAKMDKNIEDERAHLEQLKALRQQSADIDKSTASLIAGINGPTQGNTLSSYESQRSALTSQYLGAMNLGGKDQVKALEDYKNAVADLQKQFAKGIAGEGSDWYKSADILSASQVAQDAISDIERATANQQQTMAALEEQTQRQIEADRLWGQTLQNEMQAAQNEAQYLISLIADLSQQIASMEKTITLEGVDNVSSVVDDIIVKIEKLHTLAGQQINLNMASGSSGSSWSSQSSWSSSGSDTSSFFKIDADLDLSARGNVFSGGRLVPYRRGGIVGSPTVFPMANGNTGLMGEAGPEAIMPLTRNAQGQLAVHSAGSGVNFGNIIINVPASAATKSGEDWRMITRQYIVPELKKVMQ